MPMPGAVFGPGSLVLTRNDIANATPVNVGYCQEFSLDLKRELKELYGQYTYALAVAAGTTKVTGKAKAAVFSGLAMNAAFFGGTFSSGSYAVAQGEQTVLTAAAPVSVSTLTASGTTVTMTTAAAHNLQPGMAITLSGATPSAYNGTVTIVSVPTATTATWVAASAPGGNATVVGSYAPVSAVYSVLNSANWNSDLGVVYNLTGYPLTKVASNPGRGQYSVSGAGFYLFSALDVGSSLSITYAYTTAATGQTLALSNTLIGVAPTFQVDYSTVFNGQTTFIRLFQGTSSDLKLAFKLTDFSTPEVDFTFNVNAANQLGLFGFPTPI